MDYFWGAAPRVYREAKADEAQSLILRLLNRRVGNVSIELQERVRTLPLERLEELHDAAIDFTTVTDLEAWLSQN